MFLAAVEMALLGIHVFVPPIEAFADAEPKSLLAHPEDGHPGPEGYARMAALTAQYVTAHPEVWHATR